ncbi:MAG TPA: type II toxin-antitoxin system PemK/MazF family toxin [Syntrophomonadaceae bacterium]|nr:type II toxin-antitoxin system PemK/MazF family toxin [Syntrophomonadaceae bacterium]
MAGNERDGGEVAVLSTKRGFCVERGDIYLLELGSDGCTKVKQPVLVIQNDIGNRYCNSIIVVPLFPNLKLKNSMLGVVLKAGGSNGLATDHVALFTQIRTVDKSCFRRDNYLGRPDAATMLKVDEAIKLSLGLSAVQRLQARQKILQKWRMLTRNSV